MEGIRITADDFKAICRCCLCDCKNVVTFNLLYSLICSNVAADVLAKCASVQVSDGKYIIDNIKKSRCLAY